MASHSGRTPGCWRRSSTSPVGRALALAWLSQGHSGALQHEPRWSPRPRHCMRAGRSAGNAAPAHAATKIIYFGAGPANLSWPPPATRPHTHHLSCAPAGQEPGRKATHTPGRDQRARAAQRRRLVNLAPAQVGQTTCSGRRCQPSTMRLSAPRRLFACFGLTRHSHLPLPDHKPVSGPDRRIGAAEISARLMDRSAQSIPF
jgi:hypothetical protein